MATNEMQDEEYAAFVRDQFQQAGRSTTRLVFMNRGLFHARTVMSEMLAVAQDSVSIVSGCMRETVYNPRLLKAVAQRLSSPMRVLLCDPFPFVEPTALLFAQKEIDDRKIEVRLGAQEFERSDIKHFAIIDGKHIRFEQDHMQKTAIVILNANEGDAPISRSYEAFFEKAWSGGTKIEKMRQAI